MEGVDGDDKELRELDHEISKIRVTNITHLTYGKAVVDLSRKVLLKLRKWNVQSVRNMKVMKNNWPPLENI